MLLEKRCNGISDCDDFSDEFNCDVLAYDVNYNKRLIAKGHNTKIDLNVLINVLDILDIDEGVNKFSVKFESVLSWQDHRLNFVNLQIGEDTKMSKEEVNLIWKPKMILDDVKQFSRLYCHFSS